MHLFFHSSATVSKNVIDADKVPLFSRLLDFLVVF